MLFSEDKSYQDSRNNNEYYATGFISGFFVNAPLRNLAFFKTGILISEFKERIKYDSLFLYQNKDSIVYRSTNFLNSYRYFQIPINYLRSISVEKFNFLYGGGINVGVKKNVEAYVLDPAKKEFINLMDNTKKLSLVANIEVEVSRHITKALSGLVMIQYQIGAWNVVSSNLNFVQVPIGFGIGLGVKTNF